MRGILPLDEARADIDGWLEVKLATGRCSEVLRNELAEGLRRRTIDVFVVYDEIGQLEGSDPLRPTGTKPAAPMRKPLHGLMHKHYKASSMASFALNQRNHWLRPENQARLTAITTEFGQHGHVRKMLHEIVFGAHEGRHSAHQMTGEWIVYAVVGGVNYYLTLATHTEPKPAVRARVQSCFAEFPEVRDHLAW